MKLVREHINFERGLDPKTAMNVGVFSNIHNILFNEDFKHEFTDNQHRGNIFIGTILELEITPSRFIIKFYTDKFKNSITGKPLIKKKYAQKLIRDIGISDIFESFDYYYPDRLAIFKIKEEYRNKFKRGQYMPPK